jgi:hypothetical protein
MLFIAVCFIFMSHCDIRELDFGGEHTNWFFLRDSKLFLLLGFWHCLFSSNMSFKVRLDGFGESIEQGELVCQVFF